MKKKVTGVGGIFFKVKDPAATRDWYAKNLGFVTNEYGSLFESRQADNPEKEAYLQWSPMKDDTTYFEPSQNEFMVNYRVENLEELMLELKANGVTICDEIETFEYGKFLHIMDNNGMKIELWEPVDSVFTDEYKDETTK
jgi:predicted enzyme related to lactoylglutathione lyase